MTPHRPTQDFFASNGVSDRQQQPEPLGTGVDGRPANAEAKSSALLRTEQPMNRRRLLKAAGASLAGAVFGTSIATGLRPISARAAGVSAVPFRVYDSRNSAVTPGPLTEAGSPYRIFSGFGTSANYEVIFMGTLIVTGWSGSGYIYVVPSGNGAVNPYSMLGYFSGSPIGAFYSGFSCKLTKISTSYYFDVYVAGASTHVIVDSSLYLTLP